MVRRSINRRDSEMNKQINKYQSRKGSVALWHSLCTLLLRRETAGEWDGTKEQKEDFIPKWVIHSPLKKSLSTLKKGHYVKEKAVKLWFITLRPIYLWNPKLNKSREMVQALSKEVQHFGMQPITHSNTCTHTKHMHWNNHTQSPLQLVPSMNLKQSSLFFTALLFAGSQISSYLHHSLPPHDYLLFLLLLFLSFLIISCLWCSFTFKCF